MTTPELPEWIERIQGREQKATPQPWKRHPNSKYWVLLPLPENAVNLNDENDAQFAANARQDIPALLQHCLKLREAIEQAPHHPDCAYEHIAWLDPEMGVIVKQERDPCNCWKSEALQHKPEGVL